MSSHRRWVSVLGATAILCAGILSGTGVARAAFGISPPFLNADHLVPGITYTQTVYLVQDQPNVDLPVKATLSVPDEIIPWITIDKGFSFVIPQGVRQFPVQISVHVPNGQGLGRWSGNLAFTSQPSQSGQVSIALGVNVAINLTVGTGIYEKFSVPLVTFLDIEEGWNPKVDVKFQNEGNVSEAFDGATLEIFDQYDATRLAYIQKNDGFPATPAFATNEYAMEFPTDFHLGTGQYWGNVIFYQNGKVIASQKTIFHVVPAGSISGTWGRITYYLGHNSWVYYVAAGVIILLIGASWFLIHRRRSARRV